MTSLLTGDARTRAVEELVCAFMGWASLDADRLGAEVAGAARASGSAALDVAEAALLTVVRGAGESERPCVNALYDAWCEDENDGRGLDVLFGEVDARLEARDLEWAARVARLEATMVEVSGERDAARSALQWAADMVREQYCAGGDPMRRLSTADSLAMEAVKRGGAP